MKVNLSFAAFPGMRYDQAISHGLNEAVCEPTLGRLSVEQVQFAPQSCREQLTLERAQEITRRFPESRFRLHANVRVTAKHLLQADLAGWEKYPDYFAQLATVSRAINAPAYSAHAGLREMATFNEVLNAARRATDLFGCPVAVEGHYPTPRAGWKYNISTWNEYRALFESGVPFALDLSHLNIVAHCSRQTNDTLVAEMLACERCIEIHVSENDGHRDQHQMLRTEPWWWPLQSHFNPQAVVFSEGNQLRKSQDEKNRARDGVR